MTEVGILLLTRFTHLSSTEAFLAGTLFLLLVAFLVGGILYFRRKREKARPPIEEFRLEGSTVTLSGVRYPQKGKPPVVLIHGYAGNSRNWREMGHVLYENGFDVWMPNLRGHGMGSHRSAPKSSRSTSYGFEAILAEDIPLLIDEIFHQTQRKLFIVAHSIGGIATLAYLEGTYRNSKGHWKQDPEKAQALAREKVHKLALIGSPAHFHNFPNVVRWILEHLPQVVETFLKTLIRPTHSETPTLPDSGGLIEWTFQKMLSKLDQNLKNTQLVRALIHLPNFNAQNQELPRLLRKGISQVPLDLIRDVNRWIQEGEVTTQDGLALCKAVPVFVPLLFIAGEYDQLGVASEIFKWAKGCAQWTSVSAVFVKQTSHVDLVAGEIASRKIGPLLVQFFHQIGPIGEPQKPFEV